MSCFVNAAPFSSGDTSNMSSKLLSDPSYTTENELTSIQSVLRLQKLFFKNKIL